MPKGNLIISGDILQPHLDPDHVQRISPLANVIVIQFGSPQEMAAAIKTKSCFYDVLSQPHAQPAPAG